MTTGLSLHIATDMNDIAQALGYTSVTLQDSEATSDRVIAEIGKAACALQRGDIFLLTYSDHSGDVRQLIDDELCSRFREGVRIFVLANECGAGDPHSSNQRAAAAPTVVLPQLSARGAEPLIYR